MNENICFKCLVLIIGIFDLKKIMFIFLWILNIREFSFDWLLLIYYVIVGGSSWSEEIMRMIWCLVVDDSRLIFRVVDVLVKRIRGGDYSLK